MNAAAGGVQNQAGGKIVNLGTVLDDLNNAGLVLNYGAYTATVASNSGSICNGASTSNATCGSINNNSATWAGIVGTMTSNTGTIWNNGTWDGTAGVSANGTGTIDNHNLWKGSWSNNGGTINNAGTITGNVTNNSGIINNINGANSTISGDVTANGGIVNSYNPTSMIGGNVLVPGALPADVFALGKIGGNVSVNSGGTLGSFYVGDQTASIVTDNLAVAATLAPHLGQTLTVGGSVSGPITIPVDLSTGRTNAIAAGSNNGGTVNLSGMLTNPGNALWAQPTLTYATGAPIPLTATANQLLAGASSTGFYQYTPQNNDAILQSLKAGVVSAPASQVSSIITALNTSFFQNAQAFLGAPTNPTPNLLYGGIWSRAGGAAITLESTATGGGSPYSTETKSINDIGGFQFGIDEGLYNINNSKMNVHLGLTAGEAFASSSDYVQHTGCVSVRGRRDVQRQRSVLRRLCRLDRKRACRHLPMASQPVRFELDRPGARHSGPAKAQRPGQHGIGGRRIPDPVRKRVFVHARSGVLLHPDERGQPRRRGDRPRFDLPVRCAQQHARPVRRTYRDLLYPERESVPGSLSDGQRLA